MKNVNNYNFLQEKIAQNYLRGYALWIDFYGSELYMFSYKEKKFIKIDENTYEKLYRECDVKDQWTIKILFELTTIYYNIFINNLVYWNSWFF